VRAFQQYRAIDYKIKIQMISPNLAGSKYNMRKPGMEGHLLFNKAVTKWTKLSHPILQNILRWA
jgi:hypothetical protein